MIRDILAMPPPQARLEEARYFYRQFLHHSNPPYASYQLVVAYFDAFIYAYASVPEMLTEEQRRVVREEPVVHFFIVLRNINTHHSIIAASLTEASRYPRPFRRHLQSREIGQPAPPPLPQRISFMFDFLSKMFDDLESKATPSQKKAYSRARKFAAEIERDGTVFLDDLMRRAIYRMRRLLHELHVPQF